MRDHRNGHETTPASTASGPIRLKTKVYRPHRGRTVLEFLCERFRYHPRETWIDRIESGSIHLNGKIASAGMVVDADDVVEYEIDIVEPEVDFAYEILHEDEDLIAVSKSGNIPVHASGNYIRHTLIARIRADFREKLHLCHRLDRETSGIVLLARNVEARREMGRAFEEGKVRKSYLAIVHGDPKKDTFTCRRALRKIGKQHPIPRTVVDARVGKQARTAFSVLERFGRFGVIGARPETGRTNQVRVHLEVKGHPIVGDKTYGLPARLLRKMVADPDDSEVRDHLILPRHALHHVRMQFAHPTNGAPIKIEAPLPDDMRSFLEERRAEK